MSIKETVIKNDQLLMELAMYHESKGMTTTLPNPDQLFARFEEFKRLLKRQEFTMGQLEDRVYSRYGVITKEKNKSITLNDMLNSTIEINRELQRRMKKAGRDKRGDEKDDEKKK